MRSVNKVILVGNLTREVEVKNTQGGQMIATFGIATNREWESRDGMRQQSAEFHEVVAFARSAEICGEFLSKGNLVYIEGYLKTRSWIGEDGSKRFRTEVVVTDMIRLEKRAEDRGQNSYDNPTAGGNADDAFNASMNAESAESAFSSPFDTRNLSSL